MNTTYIYILENNSGRSIIYRNSNTNKAKTIATPNGFFEGVDIVSGDTETVTRKLKEYYNVNADNLNDYVAQWGDGNNYEFDFDLIAFDNSTLTQIYKF